MTASTFTPSAPAVFPSAVASPAPCAPVSPDALFQSHQRASLWTLVYAMGGLTLVTLAVLGWLLSPTFSAALQVPSLLCAGFAAAWVLLGGWAVYHLHQQLHMHTQAYNHQVQQRVCGHLKATVAAYAVRRPVLGSVAFNAPPSFRPRFPVSLFGAHA